MRRGAAVVIAACALAGAGACYRPAIDDCTVTCAVGDLCPAGLSCEDDGFCHTPGDDRTCIDASLPVDPDAEPVIPDAMEGAPDADLTPTFDYTGIFAGNRHACAIREGGALRCWGQNTSRQLSLPAGTRRTGTPTDLAGTGWTTVDGSYHTCGIRDGALYCWGENNRGESGQPASATVATITRVGTDGGWIDVSTGEGYTCGIRDNGSGRRVYCWGADNVGQLGDGAGDSAGNLPREVAAATGGGQFTDWAEVACGNGQTCARRDGGETYCWGVGGHGQLGTADLTDYPVPTPVVAAVGFTQLSAGVNFTCGIGADDNLYCWGDNGVGQLGRAQGGNSPAPTRVGTDTGWTTVSIGFYGGCGMRTGQVYCWGGGGSGEIGDGGWVYRYAPTLMPLANVVEISAGHFFNCARTSAAEVWCWGSNGDGQLGLGHVATKYAPVRIGAQSDWLEVAAGLDHTCAIRDPDPAGGAPSGEVFCWGWNNDGELGVATPTEIPSPQRLMPLDAEAGWLDVSAGSDHSCATREGAGGRELWCWGSSGLYQVGNGSGGSGHPPQRVAVSTAGFDTVETAPYASCALIAGDRWCWGEGDSNQLGNGSTANVMMPVAVGGESLVWTSISLGSLFGCGTSSGGGLYCWGVDGYGQQGQGAGDLPNATPAVVTSPGTWTEVSASFRGGHVCGVSSGALRCWGNNYSGQVGDDSLMQRDVPVAVGALAGWSRVSAGSGHTCGIESGDLYCWGANDEAQLGNEQLSSYADQPQKLDDTRTWTRVSAGQAHTCAITDGGELWCWGGNFHGAIGDGTQFHGSPVRTSL